MAGKQGKELIANHGLVSELIFNRIGMRYVVIFIIVIVSFQGQIFAQERNTLVEKMPASGKSRAFPEFAGKQIPPDSASIPVLHQNLKNSFDLQSHALSNMNFNMMNGWKTETGTLMSLKSINGFPFMINPLSLYGGSVWDIYQGTYGIRTYQLNNKLSVGTAGYSYRSFNAYALKSGIYPPTNYRSSLFVGYKFSEKFSISAGFTIQRNGDPFNINQGIQNGGMLP